MTQLLAIALLMLAPGIQSTPVSMDDLVRRLSAESIEDREKASKSIIEAWKSWSERDLEKLRRHGESDDGEGSVRARSAVTRIDLLRSIPNELWPLFPDIGNVILRSKPEELGAFFQELNSRWDKGEITSKSVATIAVGFLGDSRETGISTGYVRLLGEWIYTVEEMAKHAVLRSLHFIPCDASHEDIKTWWIANCHKSEKEWNVAVLDQTDQRVRAEAISRLARMKDPALYPRLFEVLGGVNEDYAFQLAAKGLASLPQEVLAPAMRTYLADKRFRVRLLTAKLLHPSMKRQAIDALIDAFDRPDRLEYTPAESRTVTRDVFEWFVELKDERGLNVIYLCARSKEKALKWEAVEALENVESSRAESTLLEAFDEPDQRLGCMYGREGLTLDGPRLCDLAGFILSIKMRIEKEFDWTASLRARDRNLEVIGNRWRKANGLPGRPFAGPGVALVPAEKVAGLAADLTSDSAERRASGIRGLSALGPGAWRPFQSMLEESRGVEKERLESALNSWTRTVRSVSALSPTATQYATVLNRRQHRTLDFAALRNEVIRPWFDDPSQSELIVECRRGFEGPGISIVVDVIRSPDTGVPRSIIQHYEPSGGGVMDYDWEQLENAMAELNKAKSVLEDEFEEAASFKLRLVKYYPPK